MSPNAGLLSGTRVVEMGNLVGAPYGAMALADLGADVIKVELPSGDLSRSFPPFVEGESGFFLAMNRGKRSVALNPRHTQARGWLRELIGTADVLLNNLRPGAMERMGLGEEQVRQINPQIIYAVVSAFGTQGPDAARPGIDLVFQAESGMISITGHPGDPPQKTATTIGDFLAGTNIALLICAALVERARTGQGKRVEVSLRDGLVAAQSTWNALAVACGKQPVRTGTASPFTAPNQLLEAQDGYLALAVVANAHFHKLCEAIGRPDLASRYPTNPERVAYREEIARELEVTFSTDRVENWVQKISSVGVPVGRVLTLSEVMEDPQLLAQEMFYQDNHGPRGEATLTGSPFRVNAETARSHSPAPELGEHTVEVLAELGAERQEITDLVTEGAAVAPGGSVPRS